MNINLLVTNAINKAKENPNFYDDLAKFVKLQALESIPKDRTQELQYVLSNKNLHELFKLVTKYSSDFPKQIINYINNY
ncbi:MAG: hypothetical protein AABX29_03610 [Nanoarchaeota archaeon]